MDSFHSSTSLPSLSLENPRPCIQVIGRFHKVQRDSKYKGDNMAIHLKRNSKQIALCPSLTIKVDTLNLVQRKVRVSENQR